MNIHKTSIERCKDLLYKDRRYRWSNHLFHLDVLVFSLLGVFQLTDEPFINPTVTNYLLITTIIIGAVIIMFHNRIADEYVDLVINKGK